MNVCQKHQFGDNLACLDCNIFFCFKCDSNHFEHNIQVCHFVETGRQVDLNEMWQFYVQEMKRLESMKEHLFYANQDIIDIQEDFIALDRLYSLLITHHRDYMEKILAEEEEERKQKQQRKLFKKNIKCSFISILSFAINNVIITRSIVIFIIFINHISPNNTGTPLLKET
ncbi:hypothetical protein PPL_04751 [Heterostelium album PN500]|uniref:Uncharacterized protein n=1 Tax=Heterostelium pallidum (strain ATCC 26659 / Pp 5 / PN500) TaxID=670386 RepID=D3B8F8_HETP5|nr:hypothetical protein PPL_04751 [Heterostelium album PN500]EFA82326.1 hypothetical protein PPL_04751 [Heterostelium album PN500]|eukprot:XP_020434443.1 hypothetical protein PPL_04751 [Heterostelium album PN500]